MRRSEQTVGTTHSFVLSQGLSTVGPYDVLIGAEGTRRLFAELIADPDRPDVRPQEAYQAILSSMQPGWTVRLLQTFWPDPEPRQVFHRLVQGWSRPAAEGQDILYQGLLLATEQAPLPFGRRTILEFVYPGNEGLAWWEGLGGLCHSFGVRVQPLGKEEILELARWIFNPALD